MLTAYQTTLQHISENRATKNYKLHGLSPRANYTDRPTAACRRSDSADRGCHVVNVTDPTAVFSVSRQEPLLFYQVAPQLYSRGWVDPVKDPLPFSFFFFF
jgi:hypothetical protein